MDVKSAQSSKILKKLNTRTNYMKMKTNTQNDENVN